MSEHTRNQKRMYRIHKQEEKILEQELMIASLQQKVDRLNNIINEAKEECKSVIGNPEHTIVSKNELMKLMLNILNKGDNNE